MTQGYIKLHRKILENPIVTKDVDNFAVWSYLLLNATHSEMDMIFEGKRITLKPGQLITGRKSIAKFWGINEHKVDRILKLLKNEQQIEQQTSNQNRLITILKWSDYQQNEQQIEQRVSNDRATSEQRVSTNNNVKKVKNDKNVRNNINIFKNLKPTIVEISEYCISRKNNVNAEKFFNYYESNGWKVGKNPMKDWKAAIRTWESNGYSKENPKNVVGNKTKIAFT